MTLFVREISRQIPYPGKNSQPISWTQYLRTNEHIDTKQRPERRTELLGLVSVRRRSKELKKHLDSEPVKAIDITEATGVTLRFNIITEERVL